MVKDIAKFFAEYPAIKRIFDASHDDVAKPEPVLAMVSAADLKASAEVLQEIAATDTLPTLEKDQIRKPQLNGRADQMLRLARD